MDRSLMDGSFLDACSAKSFLRGWIDQLAWTDHCVVDGSCVGEFVNSWSPPRPIAGVLFPQYYH